MKLFSTLKFSEGIYHIYNQIVSLEDIENKVKPWIPCYPKRDVWIVVVHAIKTQQDQTISKKNISN
jgi:hypothetical protein